MSPLLIFARAMSSMQSAYPDRRIVVPGLRFLHIMPIGTLALTPRHLYSPERGSKMAGVAHSAHRNSSSEGLRAVSTARSAVAGTAHPGSWRRWQESNRNAPSDGPHVASTDCRMTAWGGCGRTPLPASSRAPREGDCGWGPVSSGRSLAAGGVPLSCAPSMSRGEGSAW